MKSLQVLAFAWAAPYTLLGLVLGGIGLATGGRARRRGKVVEFSGGAVRWFLASLQDGRFLAMTLGHTILGQTAADLDACREHELIHVRQFERWGPFFGPAYLGCSAWLWLGGKHAYRDNPFERQAFSEVPEIDGP